jgi:Gpi18-like mannosyltransferase/predicted membrane-bound dolichyl-phosphate-mannose-protein mannosyltransferase
MSSTARTAGATPAVSLPSWLKPIALVLAAGFLIRLVFLPSLGFHNDVSAFEAWTLTLKDNPPWEFYAKTTFADYPPGYFIVLWAIGGFYTLLGHLHLIGTNDASYFVLRILVKLPALVMDLVDAALIYAIVRRFASQTVALVAAALFALNPATIYVSAYWGQVDSVSWGFLLLSLWLALRSGDVPAKTTPRIVWAWVAMAFSILIKPQGALVAVVLLAFAFVPVDRVARTKRLTATAFGIAAAFVIAYLVALLFHPTLNPVDAFAWLIERYRVGSAVYAYNTVNAFNLYAVKQPFWQSDTAPLPLFGIPFGPMWLWGVVLVLSATALIVARYLQERTDKAFLEASMLVAFAFFTLATRMHERYSFGAFLLAFPLLAFGRRRFWAIAILTFTTFMNLAYSFAYQTAMETHPPGIDATNLWGAGSHIIAALNVALFFALGYVYLGGSVGTMDSVEGDIGALLARARAWFDPREGIVAMVRLDWLYAGLFTIASFVMCRLFLQWPDEKIFDEIYYARAGEEYLKHLEIFEFTHPPLTKLVVTLSMILHGGLAGGDSGIGWRFLNVVVGALMVGVLYLFAKRLTGSTLFAAVATGMLLFDGFHFVQARIATPEITVAFFSLTTVYAFYRVWTASAARRAYVPPFSQANLILFGAFLAVGAVVAAGVATALVTLGPHTRGFEMQHAAWVVAFLYVEVIFYLGARWVASRRADRLDVTSYAEGSRFLPGAVILPNGERIARGAKPGQLAKLAMGEATASYSNDGRMVYATPAGGATFEPDGTMKASGGSTSSREMWTWIGLLAVSSGCLAASKWNGLFDFFVVWLCVAGVVAQRFLRRPALYGNPFGMPIDVIVGVMLIVSGAIYTACYIPFFTLGHNFLDMVALQTEMFNYHDHLVATHPYASSWWQWPILERPISYYYHDFRTGANQNNPAACCVAEILALPNPFVWWAGLITVPAVGVLAWLQRNRGYALLVIAYFLQWLPWIGSPRIAFEYHFFPNLAIIVLCNAIILQKLWNWRPFGAEANLVPRIGVGVFLAVVVWAFFFFYPVLAGEHVTWQAWSARMWIGRWII